MSALIFPEPIAAYFAADRLGSEAVARCFTANGIVQDEGRTYVGVDAIAAWKAAASARYAYTAEPLALEQSGGIQVVRSRVCGNFSGSPVDLRYHFRLERNQIASLEITA